MKYKHILWDWNGTLLNDVWLCVEIATDMLESHREHRLSMEEYKEVFGFPIQQYYTTVGFDFEIESFEDLTVKFISQYNSRVHECGLHAEVTETLNHYQQQGLGQFILSAAQKDDLIQVVQHHGINPYFQDIEGLHNHKAESKAHLGHLLFQKHSLVTDNVIMFGDTLHDFEVAQELGIDCLLIANGHQSAQRMAREVGGEHVVEHLAEIQQKLAG